MDLTGLKRWSGRGDFPLSNCDIVVAGIANDDSAVYRKGAALAPGAIRELSAVMPPVTEEGRFLDEMRIFDMADFVMKGGAEKGWKKVSQRIAEIPSDKLLTVMGGDHCSIIPVIKAQKERFKDLMMIWVDAHPDLCDYSRGGKWTCGCALRRALEVSKIDPKDVAIIGGRDYDKEEIEFIRENNMLLIGASELDTDPLGVGLTVGQWCKERSLHISFDIDVLDPSVAPGTEIPSSGGISMRSALRFLAQLSSSAKLVGLDVAEVAPNHDQSQITTLAALKIMYEFWGRVWKPL